MVGYRQTNQKTDTGKTLTRWPVFVDHFTFEAMTDAALNLGCTGLMWFTDKNGRKQRTTIWKHAQARQWPQMCNRLTDFVNVGGKRSAGLVNRRNDFKAWCLLGLSTPS